MGLMRWDTPGTPLSNTSSCSTHLLETWHQWVPVPAPHTPGTAEPWAQAHLQHTAHPLEAVLLRGIRPLLRHQHDPVVMEHRHGEHCDPGGGEEAMTTQHDRVQTLHPMRHKLRWGWRDSWSTECKKEPNLLQCGKMSFHSQSRQDLGTGKNGAHTP